MGVNYFKKTNPLKPTVSPTVPKQLESALGSGISLPMEVVNDEFVVVSGVDKVRQEIYVVLSTPIGTRLWQPDFGSMLNRLIFQPWTSTLFSELELATDTALKTWVPSIEVLNVSFDDTYIQEQILQIIIQFRIKRTNSINITKHALTNDDRVKLTSDLFTIGVNPVFKRGS